jgi:hypothetical protein
MQPYLSSVEFRDKFVMMRVALQALQVEVGPN